MKKEIQITGVLTDKEVEKFFEGEWIGEIPKSKIELARKKLNIPKNYKFDYLETVDDNLHVISFIGYETIKI